MQPTTLVPRPIHHAGWAHEKNVDGYRMVAHKNGNAGSSAGSKRLRAQPKGDVATPPMLMAFDLRNSTARISASDPCASAGKRSRASPDGRAAAYAAAEPEWPGGVAGGHPGRVGGPSGEGS